MSCRFEEFHRPGCLCGDFPDWDVNDLESRSHEGQADVVWPPQFYVDQALADQARKLERRDNPPTLEERSASPAVKPAAKPAVPATSSTRSTRSFENRSATAAERVNRMVLDASEDAKQAQKLARVGAWMDEINQRNAIQPHAPTEIEVFGLRSNELASRSPQFSAARVALVKGLAVIPLQARSSEPVPGYEPTRSEAEAYAWWLERPDLNVGILAGEQSGALVLQLDGSDGSRRWLREQIRAGMRVVETEDGTHEVGMPREWQPGRLYHIEPRKPAVTARTGWGRAFSRELESEYKAERERLRTRPVTYVFGWPIRPREADEYIPWVPFQPDGNTPFVVAKEWGFKSRSVSPGVRLFASGEPIVWEGSTLPDGRTVLVNMTPIQNQDHAMPDWLASAVGGKRKGR
jgi:hypothetical protein